MEMAGQNCVELNNEVTLRGVIEVTNVCRVNCDYCPMRRDNTKQNNRFQLTSDEIYDRAAEIVGAGIRIVLIQGGETTTILGEVERATRRIMADFGPDVEVLLNLGNFSREQYGRLRDAGAKSFILKHETSDPVLFNAMRHESLEERMTCLRDLKELGFRVGTGLISGLPGQTIESIARDIELAGELGVHMCSVSPFVPAPNTPLEATSAGDNDLALNAMACLRLLYPRLLIPSVSSLERTSQGGQLRGLEAGANVMTINFSKGEQRDKYLIYGKNRFVVSAGHVRETLRAAGLTTRSNEAANT
jgi:biotin synthase